MLGELQASSSCPYVRFWLQADSGWAENYFCFTPRSRPSWWCRRVLRSVGKRRLSQSYLRRRCNNHCRGSSATRQLALSSIGRMAGRACLSAQGRVWSVGWANVAGRSGALHRCQRVLARGMANVGDMLGRRALKFGTAGLGLNNSEQSSGRDAASFKAREWALVSGVAAYRQEPRRPCATTAPAVKRVV